jgi:hypothetical protein
MLWELVFECHDDDDDDDNDDDDDGVLCSTKKNRV